MNENRPPIWQIEKFTPPQQKKLIEIIQDTRVDRQHGSPAANNRPPVQSLVQPLNQEKS